MPYLTQQLVDDAATHLKLYKQARTKMKHAKCKESSQSTRKASPTKKTIHKRTKSETDVSWYFGKSIEFKKGITVIVLWLERFLRHLSQKVKMQLETLNSTHQR